MTKYILVFLAMTLTDVLFALYVRRASQGRAIYAAIFSLLIMMNAGYVTVSYVGNHWMIIPAGLGAFVGTFLAVKCDKKIQKL